MDDNPIMAFKRQCNRTNVDLRYCWVICKWDTGDAPTVFIDRKWYIVSTYNTNSNCNHFRSIDELMNWLIDEWKNTHDGQF